MPIDDRELAKFAKENGGWLSHYGLPQDVPWIKRDGLLPRATTNVRGRHPAPHLASRPDHVYLGTHEAAAWAMAGVHVCDVLVGELDPDLIDSDEDQAGAYATSFERFEHLPGAEHLTPRQRAETGADWAKRHSAIIDQPAWVAFSLTAGSIAYKGSIPPEALRFPLQLDAEWQAAAPGDPHVERKHGPRMRYHRTGLRKFGVLASLWLQSHMR